MTRSTVRARPVRAVRSGALLALTLAALVGGCRSEPVGPGSTQLEVVVAGGDGQYGTAGQVLSSPLRVAVRRAASKLPAAESSVRWVITEGDATLLGPAVVVTDDAGIAEMEIRLGDAEGDVVVQATLVDQEGASATLTAFLVGAPALTSLEPPTVMAGETVVLTGENFIPVPEQNVVLFSGIRGRVLAATAQRMEVEVPACLPTRDAVGVLTRLGSVASDSLPISVEAAGPASVLALGAAQELDDPGGLDCLRLPGGDDVRYLAVARSASTLGAARHPYTFAGLASGSGGLLAAPEAPLTAPAGAVGPAAPAVDAQTAFEEGLRREEEELVAGRSAGGTETTGGSGPATAPVQAPPQVGHVREFFVYNGSEDPDQRFDLVTAVARYVGARAVIYVDENAPEPGFTTTDLQTFAARFDDVIHPTVTGAFGNPSDLDGNERIAILFTPVVNKLTPKGSDSFVGGFFYGRDLLPELPSSNAGEVFYALVPDPDGVYSDARSRAQILHSVPSVLAHEFQHMVHFAERVLGLGASQEALWMLEALAQMAEELVARAHARVGQTTDAELYREGNRARARLYLERPDSVSLIVASGRGTLAERGAGFLFLLYLDAQTGGDLLERLTVTDRTGVANVEAETGGAWTDLVADWWTAVFLELEATTPSWWTDTGPWAYPGLDLSAFLAVDSTTGGSPLFYQQGGTNDFPPAASGVLPSSAARYFVLVPRIEGDLTLAFAGQDGGDQAAGAELGLRIIRLR